MENQNMTDFFNSIEDLINCKFLVAEYKLQKMLQQLASVEEVCSLVGECLEQFNRDREFSKAFVQDGHGDFMFVLPDEEYKIIALVFCTLVDIDAKKIDFTDFVKRFFGNSDNPYQNFINSMVVPFRDLLKEAFGLNETSQPQVEEDKDVEEDEEAEEQPTSSAFEDEFVKAQKIAVQIISQLEFARVDYANEMAKKICRAIVRTTDLKDDDVTGSLVFALSACKAKQVKFLVKELVDLFNR